MGNSNDSEKPIVEILCSQIILAKAESQFSAIEPEVIVSLKIMRQRLKNSKYKASVIDEFKLGIKGIPSIIYCMMWKGLVNEEISDVRIEAFKTYYHMIISDDYFISVLFKQELASIINRLALSSDPKIKHISIKILSYLSSKKDFEKDLEVYSPLYTFNSTLVSTNVSVNPKTRILALQGIKNLATNYKSSFVSNGIISTLLNILNETSEDDKNEVLIAIDCISKSADEPSVGKNLLEEHFAEIIERFLGHSDVKICASTAFCVQALCIIEKGRESINIPSLKVLHSLTKSNSSEAVIAANSALLSLCLNETKLDYFKKRGWDKNIVSTFNDIADENLRKKVVEVIYQLSTECIRYTLYDLYQPITVPMIKLIQDPNPEIQSTALLALVNLCARLDLQPDFFKTNIHNILIKNFNTFDLKKKYQVIIVLSMLSINNQELITDQIYTKFFFSKLDKREFEESEISLKEGSPALDRSSNLVTEIVKLARLTCISFPLEEVQTKMLDKLKFVYSMCKHENVKIRCRAVGTLSALSMRLTLRELLYTSGMFEELMILLRDEKNEVKSIACFTVRNILSNPDSINLWLKFDSSFVVDASNHHILSGAVQNKGLKKGTGLYADWGKEMGKNEIIKIVTIPQFNEWTVSVWFRAPMLKGIKILVQGKSGTGAIIGANDSYFFSIDQRTGAEVPLWAGIDTLKKGWHHLAVIFRADSTISGMVNGKSNRSEKKIMIQEPFEYIGNTKKGKQAFGVFCDFRLYTFAFPMGQIDEITTYNNNLINGLPDRYCEYANEADIPSLLIDLTKHERDVVKIIALEALSSLATKTSCRANMLRNSIIPVLVDSIRNVNQYIREHSARCLVNLG